MAKVEYMEHLEKLYRTLLAMSAQKKELFNLNEYKWILGADVINELDLRDRFIISEEEPIFLFGIVVEVDYYNIYNMRIFKDITNEIGIKTPVVKELDKEHIFYNGRQYIGLKRFLEVYNKVPKTGKWLMPNKYYDKNIWRKCSICNTQFELYRKFISFSGDIIYTRKVSNYCQVCGAKMESEEENERKTES